MATCPCYVFLTVQHTQPKARLIASASAQDLAHAIADARTIVQPLAGRKPGQLAVPHKHEPVVGRGLLHAHEVHRPVQPAVAEALAAGPHAETIEGGQDV